MIKGDIKKENYINVNIGTLWEQTLEEISKEISALSYEVWIKTLEPVKVNTDTLILASPSASSRNVVATNYTTVLSKCLKKINPNISKVEIIVLSQKQEILSELSKKEQKDSTEKESAYKTFCEDEKNSAISPKKNSLQPNYTFDNFIVGNNNDFTVAAAKAVAKEPGIKYNPLFIYGGVGLGKTHLLNAIGNEIKKNKPNLNVLYVTTENFQNDLIEALQSPGQKERVNFRKKYRQVDVLIIDDIQFIINKPTCQEEFFHTFNELIEMGKQIIISSDKPPKQINPLEERFRSRFEWGLITDIGIPDYDTRLAIISKKAYDEGYVVSREVIEYIANAITTNVREMEGLLNRSVCYAELNNRGVVTLNVAIEALKNYLVTSREDVKSDEVIETVCKFYHITKNQLFAKDRRKEIAQARQISMYLISEFIDMPYAAIGKIFNKDHSTVIYAKNKIKQDISRDRKFAIEIEDLKKLIKV